MIRYIPAVRKRMAGMLFTKNRYNSPETASKSQYIYQSFRNIAEQIIFIAEYVNLPHHDTLQIIPSLSAKREENISKPKNKETSLKLSKAVYNVAISQKVFIKPCHNKELFITLRPREDATDYSILSI